MTKKLYFYDSYITEFTGNVITVIPFKDRYAAIMRETYFYPESGGQPSDTGYIDTVKVLKVEIQDGTIYHIIDSPIKPGSYKCKIDFDRRFDNMQQHTGQHILSASFYKLFNTMTSSFHIGREISHIDIDKPSLTESDIISAEICANEYVYNNIPVLTYIVTPEEAAKLPLRKSPTVNQGIRIVEVKDCDFSPCGGTHVKSTGEIGIIKITRCERSKNKLRLYFVCGKRALLYFCKINQSINDLASHFSTNIDDIPHRIEEAEQTKRKMKKEISSLKNELASNIADDLYSKRKNINPNLDLVIKTFNDCDEQILHMVSSRLTENPDCLSVLVNNSKQQKFIISRSADLDFNMKQLFEDLKDHFECNGGGNSKQVQFVIKGDGKNIITFIEEKIKDAL
mgnify:FL=1